MGRGVGIRVLAGQRRHGARQVADGGPVAALSGRLHVIEQVADPIVVSPSRHAAMLRPDVPRVGRRAPGHTSWTYPGTRWCGVSR